MAHVATSPHANKMAQLEEVLELYQDLMKLDPTHFHYYKDEHSLVLLQKVINDFLLSTNGSLYFFYP